MNNLGKPALRRRKLPKNRVTIIVGIATAECIVVASDSQTSFYPGSSNRRDTDKIFALSFKRASSGGNVLVATSGDEVAGLRAVEILRERMQTSDFDDYRKPADLAQEAVSRVKKEMAELNHWQPGDQSSIEYWQETTDAALMVAYYFDNKPHIYELKFWPGVAMARKNYACLGCGATVAEFILSRLEPSKMSCNQATASAIYAVEEVKQVDSFCGGLTKVRTIMPSGFVLGESDDLTQKTVRLITERDKALKQEWKRIMDVILDEAWTMPSDNAHS